MIKADIEAKLNSISDEQLKQNLNASKNEFEHVYKKAKSTEFLAKAGKGSFDQAKKMKNIDEATKFSKNIEEMKNKFYDAENGFKHSAEKIRDRIVHEIENWKKPKDEGKFKKYLNDITDSFKIVKKMKEEIEHKFSS